MSNVCNNVYETCNYIASMKINNILQKIFFLNIFLALISLINVCYTNVHVNSISK